MLISETLSRKPLDTREGNTRYREYTLFRNENGCPAPVGHEIVSKLKQETENHGHD